MNEEEQQALEKYRGLTENGKRLVRIVINEEYERVKSQEYGLRCSVTFREYEKPMPVFFCRNMQKGFR